MGPQWALNILSLQGHVGGKEDDLKREKTGDGGKISNGQWSRQRLIGRTGTESSRSLSINVVACTYNTEIYPHLSLLCPLVVQSGP